MKRHLIAVAVAASFAAPAMAQVTVGGAIDSSYVSKTVATAGSTSTTFNANGSRTVSGATTHTISGVDNAFWSTSQINFKGVEDLGGGLTASFHVEGAVLSDVGSANLADRASMVSLSGGFGTISLGRGSTAMNDASSAHGLGNFANLPITVTGRPNNAINFTTPSFNGFSARVTKAEGESVNNDKSGDYSAVSLHGTVGKFTFAVIQANEKQVRATSAGRVFFFNNTNNTGTGSEVGQTVFTQASTANTGVFAGGTSFPTFTTSNVLSITTATAAVDGKLRDSALVAGYDFGMLRVQAQHIKSKSSGTVSNGNGIQLINRRTNAVSLIAPVGATTLFVNLQEIDRSKDERSSATGALNALSGGARTNDKSDVTIFGANYALSKRTNAYIVHRKVDNGEQSNYLSGVNGQDAKSTAVGIRHSF